MPTLAADAESCPPLAALAADAAEGQRALVPLAGALRGVACTPSLFGMTTAAARSALEIPADLTFELGRRYARLGLGDAPVRVADLLAAMGLDPAATKMRFEPGFTSSWVVELAQWGPGVIMIDIPAERSDIPTGTLAELPADAEVSGSIRVVMPPEALAYDLDPHAARLVADALGQLASNPALLRDEPERIHAQLGLGERFDLYRYSIGSGDEERLGVAIRPRRTELVAAPFAETLGLERASHQAISIFDANPHRLATAGQTPFSWNGLQLEVELDEREAGTLGLHRWVVSDIQVLPTSE